MESTLFKITITKKYSGIFYGPMTIVYGLGVISIELLNEHLFKKIKTNIYLKYLIEFLILILILSLIEFICGTITHYIFNIDMWDYSTYKFHLGKYICLKNSIIWGLLGLLYINFIKKITDRIINQFTKKETLLFSSLFLIDSIIVIITKI